MKRNAPKKKSIPFCIGEGFIDNEGVLHTCNSSRFEEVIKSVGGLKAVQMWSVNGIRVYMDTSKEIYSNSALVNIENLDIFKGENNIIRECHEKNMHFLQDYLNQDFISASSMDPVMFVYWLFGWIIDFMSKMVDIRYWIGAFAVTMSLNSFLSLGLGWYRIYMCFNTIYTIARPFLPW